MKMLLVIYYTFFGLLSNNAIGSWSDLVEHPSCLGNAQHAKIVRYNGQNYSVAYEHDVNLTEHCCFTIAQFESDRTRTIVQRFCLQKHSGKWYIAQSWDPTVNPEVTMSKSFDSKQEVYGIAKETADLIFHFAPK